MSYYFPFGNAAGLSTPNVNFTLTAISASYIAETFIPLTASFASAAINTPPPGPPGASVNFASCSAPVAQGSQGFQGSTGFNGTSITTCPPGTIECPGLNVSLSLFVNPNRASGSQFSIVCIKTEGYVPSTIGCPEYLPTSSGYVTPTIP